MRTCELAARKMTGHPTIPSPNDRRVIFMIFVPLTDEIYAARAPMDYLTGKNLTQTGDPTSAFSPVAVSLPVVWSILKTTSESERSLAAIRN